MWFHTTLYSRCKYLCMLGLKLFSVKGVPRLSEWMEKLYVTWDWNANCVQVVLVQKVWNNFSHTECCELNSISILQLQNDETSHASIIQWSLPYVGVVITSNLNCLRVWLVIVTSRWRHQDGDYRCTRICMASHIVDGVNQAKTQAWRGYYDFSMVSNFTTLLQVPTGAIGN